MKKVLPEYFKPSDEEIKQLWQTATVVLDANVLLNLFRYSTKSREELIKILRYYKNRLWIPYQVAFEFLENCNRVPASLSKTLSDTIKAIDGLPDKLEGLLNLNQYDKYHLIRPDDIRKEFRALQKKLHEKVSKIQKEYEDVDKESIVNKITELLEGRVGEDFEPDRLTKLFAEGEKRYNEKTPPGYKDLEDKKGAPKRHLYGDMIWWEQAIEYAKCNKCDLVIVIDDSKEDWWYKVENQTKSPRVELIREFRLKTEGQKFHMYRTARFMELAKEFDKVSISDTSINEVKLSSSLGVIPKFNWSHLNSGSDAIEDSVMGLASGLYNMEPNSFVVAPRKAYYDTLLGYQPSSVIHSSFAPIIAPDNESLQYAA